MGVPIYWPALAGGCTGSMARYLYPICYAHGVGFKTVYVSRQVVVHDLLGGLRSGVAWIN